MTPMSEVHEEKFRNPAPHAGKISRPASVGPETTIVGQPPVGNTGGGLPEMDARYQKLLALLNEMRGALVAFSGGVDSSLLLAAARDALGDSLLAVTATSPTFPVHELESARRIASHLGVRWITLETDELDDRQFTVNSPRRCYFCKKKKDTSISHGGRKQMFRSKSTRGN